MLRLLVCLSLLFISTTFGTNVSNECPIECDCTDRYQLHCINIQLDQIPLSIITNHINSIQFDNCIANNLDFSIFTTAALQLRQLDLINCQIDTISNSNSIVYHQLESINLHANRISNWSNIIILTNSIAPYLRRIDLSSNSLTTIDDRLPTTVLVLNVSSNRIGKLHRIATGIDIIDLSHNWIQNLDHVHWPIRVTRINLSYNDIERVDAIQNFGNYSKIEDLDLSHNPIESIRFSIDTLLTLRRLVLTHTRIRYFDLSTLPTRALLRLNLSYNDQLSALIGQLPPYVREFDVTGCRLTMLPNRIFDANRRLLSTIVVRSDDNPWICNDCLMRRFPPQLLTNCTNISVTDDDQCDIGVSARPNRTILVEYTRDAIIGCEAFGDPDPMIQWFRDAPRLLIGSYDPESGQVENIARNYSYEVLPGGALVIHGMDRSQVGKYTCVVTNKHGESESIVYLRLDMTSWYRLAVFDSVFIGSMVCALLTCVAVFALNLVWLALRKMILWWIQRAERISRVSKMVEAMERYRQRQMLHLHETYNRRVTHVRDHYHQQVEQLRTSYASQSDRFRDYRAAQFESMNAHLDNIRDNYSAQMGRMREFGSRRADQLWESYERQLNRIRTFSLQQRLRIMRQYKIKQRYLNKLLESVNVEQYQMEVLTREDSKAATAAILAALDAVMMGDEDAMMAPMSAASSYYSLDDADGGDMDTIKPATVRHHTTVI